MTDTIRFDMTSPKARAMGACIARKSVLRSLYKDNIDTLIAMTAEQRPPVAMDFTARENQAVFGKFNLGSRKSFKGLFGKGIPPLIVTYVIEHTSGAAYVGSTEDFFTRWRNHAKLLRAHGHKNVELQRLFDADGFDAFTIRILRHCDNVDGLLDYEVEDSMQFKHLLNLRIGSRYTEGWAARARTHNYVPKAKRGPQTKARWYDGQASQGGCV